MAHVIATTDKTVYKFNIRTRTGRKSTKDFKIKAGDKFEVHKEFLSTGMATHGDACYELVEGTRLLLVEARYFTPFVM